MPAERAQLSLDLSFTDAEFQKLIFGRIPEQMEDKWFIFFEPPWLHFHRSWTGDCIYQVRFHSDGSTQRIAEVVANRNPNQYRPQTDEQDTLLVSILLYDQVGRDSNALWEKYAQSRKSRGNSPRDSP